MQIRVLAAGLTLLASVVAGCKSPPREPIKRPAIDQARFESLYRAAKTIQASLAVGLTYAKLGELQQEFATEIAIGKDKATTDKERALVQAYATALLTLQDSMPLWKKQIEDSSNDLVAKGDIVVEGPKVPEIVERYGFVRTSRSKTYKYAHHTLKWETVGPEVIQTVWAKAGEQLDEANKLYYAEEIVNPQP